MATSGNDSYGPLRDGCPWCSCAPCERGPSCPDEGEIKAAKACSGCGVSTFYQHTRRCMELKGLVGVTT